MKLKVWLPAFLLLLPGCGDFDSGVVSDSGTEPTSAVESSSAAGPEVNAAIRAREAGPAMGATQRSTAQDGSVVFQAQSAVLPADTNSFPDIYLRDGAEMILVSKPTTGGVANNESQTASISRDGQKVVFASKASNLVPGDTNNDWDIFLYDRATDSISRVSTDGAGAQGTHRSVAPSLSANGTKVTFLSRSRFGTQKANNTYEDVFYKHLDSGEITLVSRNGATPSNFHSYDPTISGDGTKVAYASRASNLVANDTNGRQDIFVYDAATGLNRNITPTGNGQCYWPSISGSGQFVAYNSAANNLVAGDTNARQDIFLWNASGPVTTRIGAGNGHAGQVAVAENGHKVAFASAAADVTGGDSNGKSDIFVYDLGDYSLTRTSVPTGAESNPGDSDQPGFSWGNVYVTYRTQSGDFQQPSEHADKIIRRNLASGSIVASSPQGELPTMVRVSESETAEGNNESIYPSISADGRYVAFYSLANNLVDGDTNGAYDIFVRDLVSGTIELVSTGNAGQGNNSSYAPSISADGKYVAFESSATNLVDGDTGYSDIFVRDLENGTTELVSTGSGGPGNHHSGTPRISADGRHVAFRSHATNLVDGDTNGNVNDIFVRDLENGTTVLASTGSAGQANSDSREASISADGRYVAFRSQANNLVDGDTNGAHDIFVRDLVSSTTVLVSTGSAGQGDGDSLSPSISAEGKHVAFISYANNLVDGDTNGNQDVFVRDLVSGANVLASTGSAGQANSGCYVPSISADGRYLAFHSVANNLVDGDTNGTEDIFVRDLVSGTVVLASTGSAGQGNSHSREASISADGRYVAFMSYANNMVDGDTNGSWDVFRAATGFLD
jgi:Tol biopolymer transport system component